MRRRRYLLVLVPLLLGFFLLRPRVPVAQPLALHFGARAPSLREADLKFERDESVVRDLTLLFPSGAPTDVERSVRLAPGEYRVGIRLVYAGSDERRLTRTVRAGDGMIDIDAP